MSTDRPKKKFPDPFVIADGGDAESYAEYMKQHRKELRRLQREASGRNTHEPPDGDY